MKKECSKCKANYDSELNYCPKCGIAKERTEESTTWVCHECGRVNVINDNYCGMCGLPHDDYYNKKTKRSL